MYDFPFKVGIKCRLIIDKLEFVTPTDTQRR